MLKLYGEGKSVIVFASRGVGLHFSGYVTFLVVDIGSDWVPAFVDIFKAESDWSDSLFKEWMFFYEINDVESNSFVVLIFKGEVEPVIVSTGIGIVLKYEIVVFLFLFNRPVS